ncbi:alanine racemase [Pseudonocardia acaciae]|uniref:alanine racemase n=1 Tax=Pseudonocardia acaciae TaxID=551276 RepID=UPI00048B4503|nr:alanine racemase [Pseudonocardia acaciae]
MDLTLPAKRAEPTRRLLDTDVNLLYELADAIGGPFHVLFAEPFDAAVAGFRAAAADAGVSASVYYAKKANKAALWPRRCAETGVGVDVASTGELASALTAGVRAANLVVTGPAKSDELLRLALLQGCLLTVDAPDELDRALELAERYGRRPRVLMRVNPPGSSSRFGLTEPELDSALLRCRGVDLEGFGFHLEGYEVAPRAALAAELVGWVERARGLGLAADAVDIGGGFAVDYVDGEHWRGFQTRPDDFHAGREFPGYYPYHSPVAGPDMLRAILSTPVDGAPTLAELLRARNVRLLCEPGRALLDQAGLTVLRVQGVKDRDGYGIVTVDGTSLSLSEQWFNSEFLPDPVLLGDAPAADGKYPACVGGATCLESDLLTWRKIPFGRRPRVGDLLVYLNTAGYQMDSNESEFHQLPLPPKVVVRWEDDTVRWRWDER